MARRFGSPALILISTVLLGLLAPPATSDAVGGPPAVGTQEDPTSAKTDGASQQGGQLQQTPDWQDNVDEFFGDYLVAPLHKVLFFDFWSERWLRLDVPQEVTCSNEKPSNKKCGCKIITSERWPDGNIPIVITCPDCGGEIETGLSVPLVVLWLFCGAVFFTLRMGFINVRGFLHGVRLIRGDYDDPDETGEVSHFQALASALSATIGLGNIAGVAIAVGTGGPGAVFWMILAGLIGMSSKFAECSLSQMYRKVSPDGTVSARIDVSTPVYVAYDRAAGLVYVALVKDLDMSTPDPTGPDDLAP
ncbi:hypothetical protein LCGC14_2127990, partial [marine sediment metagenome]